jgi:phage gpG-like protein
MSDITIKIELPPESQALIKNFAALPDELPKAIKRGMDSALSVVRGRIQTNRLSGKGPYPPSEHRLGIVTQQLQRSLREEPAVIAGDTVTGAIGTPVIYGAVHEFGFSGTVRGRGGKDRKMNIPERAPVRTGISENADYIAGEIGAEIDKSLNDLSKG